MKTLKLHKPRSDLQNVHVGPRFNEDRNTSRPQTMLLKMQGKGVEETSRRPHEAKGYVNGRSSVGFHEQ